MSIKNKDCFTCYYRHMENYQSPCVNCTETNDQWRTTRNPKYSYIKSKDQKVINHLNNRHIPRR